MRTMSGETLKRFVKFYHDNEDVPVTVLVEKAYAQGVFAPGEKPSMACIYTLLRKERGVFGQYSLNIIIVKKRIKL